MRRIIGTVICVLALGGCALREDTPQNSQSCDFEAGAVAKAATHIFDTDHIDYDVAVGKVFSQDELLALRRQLDHVVPMIQTALGRQDSVWGAKLAGHFQVKEVLPLLHSHFFTPRRCYTWEGPDYSNPESYLTDNQYQYTVVYLAAIQMITGKPIHEAVSPDPSESSAIAKHASNEKSEFHHWALWMKRKLRR